MEGRISCKTIAKLIQVEKELKEVNQKVLVLTEAVEKLFREDYFPILKEFETHDDWPYGVLDKSFHMIFRRDTMHVKWYDRWGDYFTMRFPLESLDSKENFIAFLENRLKEKSTNE